MRGSHCISQGVGCGARAGPVFAGNGPRRLGHLLIFYPIHNVDKQPLPRVVEVQSREHRLPGCLYGIPLAQHQYIHPRQLEKRPPQDLWGWERLTRHLGIAAEGKAHRRQPNIQLCPPKQKGSQIHQPGCQSPVEVHHPGNEVKQPCPAKQIHSHQLPAFRAFAIFAPKWSGISSSSPLPAGPNPQERKKFRNQQQQNPVCSGADSFQPGKQLGRQKRESSLAEETLPGSFKAGPFPTGQPPQLGRHSPFAATCHSAQKSQCR
jgi:hypothetical protein